MSIFTIINFYIKGDIQMQKMINKIQIFRHLIQIISLFLSPGLFILAFDELKKIYEMLAKGNFNFIQAFPNLVEFTTVIFITIMLGRFFCGWICAFGAFNDLIHAVSKNIFKINFKVNKKVDAVLKYVKYLVLLLIIVLAWTMGSNVFQSASPWDAFAQITDLSQVLSNYTVGCILLVLITIGAFFVERFFCRYLCPLGAVFTILSKISIFKIKKPTDKCGKCRLCTNNCSMGLPLYKVNNVCGGDCINCLKCVETCPRKNTQANVLGENVNPALASSVAIAAFTGVYAVNNLAGTALLKNGLTSTTNIAVSTNSSSAANTSNNNASKNSSSINVNTANNVSNSSTASHKYKDGTYTGIGTGFRGGTTKIAVTIKNDKITSIETVSTEDTPRFYQDAESMIPDGIISSQSTSVDTVSGATFSSRGIISAVQNALSQAKL
jgi:polyferredoxin